MPELLLKADELLKAGKVKEAAEVQYAIDAIIYAMCACKGNLYAVMKEILQHPRESGHWRRSQAPAQPVPRGYGSG